MGRVRSWCAVAFMLAVAQPGSAWGARGLPAHAITRDLRAGRPVVLQGVDVTGPLRLSAADSVEAVFKCRRCTFEDAVTVSDAKFERTVDLTGSDFMVGADFRGVEFEGPALLRGSEFAERADFSLAVFGDLSTFTEALFDEAAVFSNARFEDAAFVAAEFDSARFDGATFRGAARFHGASVDGFATFSDADFRRRSDFSSSEFDGGVDFSGAQFGGDASLLGATFVAPGPRVEAATFQDASAAENLNFTFATFDSDTPANKPRATALAAFPDLVCGGSLIFDNATFAPGDIDMQRLQAHDLIFNVDVAAHLGDKQQRRSILTMIENSAKARDDLQAANDAHYALRVDRSKDFGAVKHTLDAVFYRGIAGYFVRPFRPLVILFAIVALLSLLNAVRVARGASSESDLQVAMRRGRRVWTRTSRDCGNFLVCFLDKLGLIRPQRGDGNAPPPLRTRLEGFVYRVLVVCAVLGLANSNPTLRQMVETLL